MAAPQATATGTLGSTPLPNLLVYSLDRRLTGTLVLEDDRARKSAILFRAGAPVKVKLGERVARLPDVVVALRLTDAETAAAVEAEANTQKRLYGQALVSRGVMDVVSLDEALEEQVFKRIEWLCGLGPTTVFGYYDEVDLLAQYGGPEGARVEPLAVIWRALRLMTHARVVDATLAKLGSRELRLHPQSRAAKFRFDAKEQAVVDVLRAKPQPLANIIATDLLTEAKAKTVVYALIVTRHLDLGGTPPVGASEQSLVPSGRSLAEGTRSSNPAQRHPVSVTPALRPPPTSGRPTVPARQSPVPPVTYRPITISESPSVPPSATPERSRDKPSRPATSTPRDEAFVTEIRSMAGSIGQKNHYQVLGVETDASASVIQTAFFRLAKRWHPDRLGSEYADVKDLAVRVFARMTEANQTLSNDAERREYDRLLGSNLSAEEKEVQRVLGAVTAFQKAEVLAKRGNLAEAEEQAALAVQNDPEQAEYIALHADILSQNPERQKTNDFTDIVKMVNTARKKQPDNVKVRVHRARVLSRSGDAEGAYREYRRIVERDANNVEAAREVRLYEMRNGKKTTDPRRSLMPGESRRPQANAKGAKTDNKGALNQDIGQIFGKLFKR